MNRLANILKSSRFLYNLYFYTMSTVLKGLGFLVGFNERLILFNCFGGKKYDDSPKVIYEKMLQDSRFDGCVFVWALHNPNSVVVPGRAKVIKADSFRYFVTALRSKIWITNSSIERGLDFKKKKTICINTWHGTPIKLMGVDISDDSKSFKSKVLVRADVMLAQSRYDIDVFSRAFCLKESVFRLSGLPRNDLLANYSQEQYFLIKEKLNIEKDKIVLLYAPTFREYSRDESNVCVLDAPIDLAAWQRLLGDNYIVLFRAHYEVAKHMSFDNYPMFIDVSSYPDLNELMIASDALISDYSSIYFDYSIMHKPMYCYAYDYDQYLIKRGMYIDLKNELPCVIHYSEVSLLEELHNFVSDRIVLSQKTKLFQSKYVSEYGHAADVTCDIVSTFL